MRYDCIISIFKKFVQQKYCFQVGHINDVRNRTYPSTLNNGSAYCQKLGDFVHESRAVAAVRKII